MKQGTHGGDINKAANYIGCAIDEIHDYSSNVSPWAAELDINPDYLKRLPEPHSETLAKAFAEKYGHDFENVCITSGTTEAIEAICRKFAGGKAKMFDPTYSDYKHYCDKYGIEKIGSLNADICFMCNPNNPTGSVIERETLLTMINATITTTYVVDESYMPFHLNEKNLTLTCELLPNVAVLRSFSKIYGLPGLRLGGVISGNKELIRYIKENISPWSVNSLAQSAGLQLLVKDTSDTVSKLNTRMNVLINEIIKLGYLLPAKTEVNFVLCKLTKGTSSELFDHCIKQKVLIRDCSNFDGLDNTYVRFAVNDNLEPLLEALRGY